MKRFRLCWFVVGIVVVLQYTLLWPEEVRGVDADNGLRLSVAVDYGTKDLLFSIQNVSDRNTQVVALGTNGIPVNLTIVLTTRDGKIRDMELGMSSAMHAMGAGIYENVVELVPNSTYVIRHAMDDFTPIPPMASETDRVFPLKTLNSGDLIAGRLHGRYSTCSVSDCRLHVTCWTGKLVSNTVQIK